MHHRHVVFFPGLLLMQLLLGSNSQKLLVHDGVLPHKLEDLHGVMHDSCDQKRDA
jgi:hypothetical protein